MLQGKALTVLAVVLAGASMAGAFGLAVSGALEVPAGAYVAGRGAAGDDTGKAAAEVALARNAERAGDVAGALSHYRAAALLDPRLVDPRSPFFLGPGFEARLRKWIAGRGTGGAGAQARTDAAYLFRRMYGGCG